MTGRWLWLCEDHTAQLVSMLGGSFPFVEVVREVGFSVQVGDDLGARGFTVGAPKRCRWPNCSHCDAAPEYAVWLDDSELTQLGGA